MTLAGRSAGGACPPTRIVRNAAGSMRASAVGTSDVRVHPSAAARATASASNASCTVHGVPVTSERVTTDSPPTWESGRQASQRSAVGIDAEAGAGGSRRRLDRGVGEDDELRLAGGAAGGHDERVAVLDGLVEPRRGQRAASRAGGREPRVDGEHGVAVGPRALQRRRRRARPAASRATRRAMGGSVRTARVRLGRHDRPRARPVPSGWRSWVAGARPRTLPAAVVPVLVGTACVAGEADVSAPACARGRRRRARRCRSAPTSPTTTATACAAPTIPAAASVRSGSSAGGSSRRAR